MGKNKIKHSKLKNVGIIFELLIRKLTSDIITNNNSPAQNIIKEHFNSKSELLKEYELYSNLYKEKFNNETKANLFIDAVLKSRKKINERKLKREKFNLIKKINENYNINDFFKTNVSNYKVLASIYKLFEEVRTSKSYPLDSIKSRYTLVEHINEKKDNKNSNKIKIYEEYKKQNKDVRLLSYKILVERFNKKYQSLDKNQKRILKEYINHISNSPELNKYVKSEITNIKLEISKHINKINDKITKIKLNEIKNLLNEFSNKRKVDDNDILIMLRYYELIKELKNV